MECTRCQCIHHITLHSTNKTFKVKHPVCHTSGQIKWSQRFYLIIYLLPKVHDTNRQWNLPSIFSSILQSYNYQTNHTKWMKMSVFGWMCYFWSKLYIIIDMWLHHFNECCKCGYKNHWLGDIFISFPSLQRKLIVVVESNAFTAQSVTSHKIVIIKIKIEGSTRAFLHVEYTRYGQYLSTRSLISIPLKSSNPIITWLIWFVTTHHKLAFIFVQT